MKTATTALIVLVGLFTSSCGRDDGILTGPTQPTLPASEVFTGTLAPQGSSFYSFTVSATSDVGITLASLVATSPGPALTNVMGLGVGTPEGTDCTVTNSVTTAPGLTAQLVNSLTAGTYCAKIYDLGTLTGPVTFAVRIVHQ